MNKEINIKYTYIHTLKKTINTQKSITKILTKIYAYRKTPNYSFQLINTKKNKSIQKKYTN